MDTGNARDRNYKALIIDIILVCVLLIGAYFRWVGIDWGDYHYLHPDERFLVWVGTDITPVKCLDESYPLNACPPEHKDWMSWGEYFDTAKSTLNPHNQGHGFYVYGTLPLFLARYGVEWLYGQSGFNEMTDVGRALSVLADLLTVFLVYLIGARVYNQRVGLLASAFSAMVVLQIQQSHFFTVDNFLNIFTWLAIYFAVRVASGQWEIKSSQPFLVSDPDGREPAQPYSPELPHPTTGENMPGLKAVSRFIRHPYFRFSFAFGFALGCAVASKLSSAPVAVMLPAAFALTFVTLPPKEREKHWVETIAYLLVAAVVSILVFRLFQPYAFSGPGFLGMKPNPQWVANIREQRIQAAGDVDFPPAMQWARRPIWFSAQNMILWGLGLPLGILAWAGFVWVGIRMLKGDWQKHILLWGWTDFYFVWQSLAFNPTMRYQLPIYPALAIYAGWIVIYLWDLAPKKFLGAAEADRQKAKGYLWRVFAVLVGGSVLLATFAWAFGFTRIYDRLITRVEASHWIYQNVPGPINLHLETGQGSINQPVPFPYGQAITPDQPYQTVFTANARGSLKEVYLPHIVEVGGDTQTKQLVLTISQQGGADVLNIARVESEFGIHSDPRGDGYTYTFDQPLVINENAQYQLKLELLADAGSLTLSGAAPANESSWDDGLPLRLDGYDGYGGFYQPGLNFEMYWDENPEKLERYLSTLDQADHIFISSSRQWGSLPRLPERFPLTIEYYRRLLGCPPDRQIEWCYNVAQPGMFAGELGFELAEVFQSDPGLGSINLNDQPSEEAFTVYDHPKVFIFRKTSAYDPGRVRDILGAVDLSKVIHVTPKQAAIHPANLLLPPHRWAEQKLGGTWAELFNSRTLFNRNPYLGAMLWYLTLGLIGLISYPLVRLVLPGLADRGYPFARVAGLLLLAYFVWAAGSLRIPYSRLTITVTLLSMSLVSAWVAYRHRDSLRKEWRQRWKYFLLIEGLFLAFFAFDLLVRIGNPDLWHPWKGGEKPMDFAYFNAVLKSTSFPPYDPWYAGGYLNYYYYGFVLMGTLVKLLGIVPAAAYNLILPSLFALIAMGAFSMGWNLIGCGKNKVGGTTVGPGGADYLKDSMRLWSGLAAAFGMAVLGNLGIVRMIVQGYQRLAAPGGVIDGAGFLTRMVWTIRGAVLSFTGTPLPYSLGDWYWIPSRVIPAPGEVEPITEFPFFTVLYADPHAHLFALPVTLLVLAIALSMVLARGRWLGVWVAIFGFFLAGLSIGALRVTNTWDFYPYLILGNLAVAYSLARYWRPGVPQGSFLGKLPETSQRFLVTLGGMILLTGLSLLLYQPFVRWYGQGYSQIELWKGSHTTLSAYFTHWGLFLFVIVTWMVWETRDWMAQTPLSSLRKLSPYKVLIEIALILMVVAVLLLVFLGVQIAWLVLPLAAWAGVLLLRPGMPDSKRFVAFLVGTGLTLTLMVEVIVLRGDIARMNTVFKFYLQVWTLFAVSAAAALGWLIIAIPFWSPRWRNTWQLAFVLLVAGTLLYPLLGGMAKIEDRMAPQAPHTLDGMAFMQYAEYADVWGVMDLSQDYRAIRWLQENVSGSPVIVEANLRDLYRWGSRYSIYTGLPGVVGWEWHQQQQRALLPGSWVSDRIAEVDNFYITTDIGQARDFLRKYDVRYIILGQQERGHYPGEGLDKFPAAEGVLWRTVYQDGETEIYKVLSQ